MRIRLLYGTGGLDLDVPGSSARVIAPRFLPGLPDEAAAFRAAVAAPIGCPPLRDIVRPGERLAVVIPDITRPLPSDRLLPWLFEALAPLPPEQVTILNGTGSHRGNTPGELARMVGPDILRRYRIVNHDAECAEGLCTVGRRTDGAPLSLARAYVEADRRIALGFIEPHFMAGFSGGCKGVFPALADIDSILHYHGAAIVADPRSTWGVLAGNPTQALIRQYGRQIPLDFLINVTLNRERQITRFFCGDPIAAHEAGCAFVRETAMAACPQAYPIVVTTNAGYPLDQNLYQAVKGMSAAAQIVAPGGLILAAARCNDGFPDHGHFKPLLHDHPNPQAVLDTILAPGFRCRDQWEAQLLAQIAIKARIGLYSELPPEAVRRAHLEPVADLNARLRAEWDRLGPEAPIAILPEGPMTIPYLA